MAEHQAGAPNLTLNLNPATVNQAHRTSGAIATSGRPHTAKHNKGHNIVQKDFYRHMKSDRIVGKHLAKKKSQEPGRVPPKSLLDMNNSKYKNVGEIISEQYARSQIPEGRLYMIDKVVRMRGQHGRYGIDHSELLNYELEQTNKPRDDYMNVLVYKADANSTCARDLTMVPPKDATISSILFNRLNVKDDERYSDYSQRSLLGIKESKGEALSAKPKSRGNGMSY